MKKQVLVILGPTASGKSAYGIKLAKSMNGEIVSCDSRQVYKELDIGTAKLTKNEMRGIPHYCINLTSVKKVFTVSDFKECANEAISKILDKGKIPILVGGSAFYINAVLNDVNLPEVPPNPKLRNKLEKYPIEKLLTILDKKDPARARTIDRKNKRRIIRALEIIKVLGKVPQAKKELKYQAKFYGMKISPEDLKKKIIKRTDKMVRRGLVRETKKIRALGLAWKRIYELGFEYKYPALYIQNKISEKEMIDSINKETIEYARRQMLWWKKDKQIKWVKLNKYK